MVIKIYKSLIPVLMLLLLIAGCKIGPNYKRPQTDNGKSYRFAQAKDSVSFADTSWNSLFSDLVLKNLITSGLKNNFDLRIAYQRILESRAAFKSTRADLFPSVGFDANAAYNKQQSPAGGMIEYHDYYGTANLSWELDIWGKLRRAKESARAQMLSQEAFSRSMNISMVAAIASGYFNLIEYQDELQITRYNVAIREEALELVKAKLIAGTVSGLVVAQAEAELAFVKTQIPALEKVVGMQEDALRLLTGELPGAMVTGDSIINQINPAIVHNAGIPSQLIVRRPDIIAAEQELISANAQIGVARGMMLPSLRITAGMGYSDLGMGMIGSAVGSLVGPVFNFNKLRLNVHRAQAVKEEMLITYQKTIYTAIKEVSDGILSVEKDKNILAEDRNLLAAVQTAYDLSNQLFNAGYASYLDVLDAQRNLYNAQVRLARSQNNYLQSVVGLYLALGGGWR